MNALLSFLQQLGPEILIRTYEHVYLVFFAMVIATILALFVGIYLARCQHTRLVSAIMGIAGAIQTVPSLALIAFIVVIFAIINLPTILHAPNVERIFEALVKDRLSSIACGVIWTITAQIILPQQK